MSNSKEGPAPVLVEPQPLSLKLDHGNTTVIVDGQLKISFRRTIRIPVNKQVSNLPPDLGTLKLVNVDEIDNLPGAIKVKGGLVIPMYENEALWIKFVTLTKKSYAIKLLNGNINAITGESDSDTEGKKQRQQSLIAQGKSIQDYVVAPGQPWLNGCVIGPGKVQQFVATALDRSKSVEAQITGIENSGALQFQITPEVVYARTPGFCPFKKHTIELTIKAPNNGAIKVNASPDWEVFRISEAIKYEEGVPPGRHWIIFKGKQLNHDLTLFQYGIINNATLYLAPRQLSLKRLGKNHLKNSSHTTKCSTKTGFKNSISATKRPAKMGARASDNITRLTAGDYKPKIKWDKSQTLGFNVQLINSEIYGSLTGLPNPNLPLSWDVYMPHTNLLLSLSQKGKSSHDGDMGMDLSLQAPSSMARVGEYQNHLENTEPSNIRPNPNKMALFKSTDQLLAELQEN